VLFLALVCSGLAIGASRGSAASTSATSACWRDVLGDWFTDGRIDKIYPLPCYSEAVKHLPPDATQYSGARDDIQRALQQALREKKSQSQKGGGSSPATTSTTTSTRTGKSRSSSTVALPVGSGSGPGSSGNAGGGGSAGSGGSGGGNKSALERVFDKIGPANAESIPVPLLVLGGIAILLLLTAGASFGFRRYQARRMQPQEPDPKQL
jgi:cobalamin biosynthesis Mg chelatase CobN